MKERMLILCYRAPYPLRSGSEIRMYQFIEVLSKYYEVDIVYLSEQKEGTKMDNVRDMAHDVQCFYVGKIKRLMQAAVGYCFKGQPLQIGYFYSKQMQEWISEHLDEYQRILCMHIRTFSYLQGIDKSLLEGKKIYLDGIDAISLNYRNSYMAARGIKKLIYKIEYKRLEKYEKITYTAVHHTSLISQRDKEYMNNHLGVAGDAKLIYLFAIDMGYVPEIVKNKRTISFMGKMNYAPNEDAVLHFIRKIYPKIKTIYPDLEFNIIGGFATKELLRYDGKMGIHFLGFVDNPSTELQRSTLVIAPMISGSGLQTKILQAMQLGCAVLTTEIGADGLESVNESDIIIAQNDEDMIAKLGDYLSEQMMEKREEIGQNARRYVMEHYSYEAIEKQILEWMEES